MASISRDPEETTQWEIARPRHIGPAQWSKYEGYAAEICSPVFYDPEGVRQRG